MIMYNRLSCTFPSMTCIHLRSSTCRACHLYIAYPLYKPPIQSCTTTMYNHFVRLRCITTLYDYLVRPPCTTALYDLSLVHYSYRRVRLLCTTSLYELSPVHYSYRRVRLPCTTKTSTSVLVHIVVQALNPCSIKGYLLDRGGISSLEQQLVFTQSKVILFNI